MQEAACVAPKLFVGQGFSMRTVYAFLAAAGFASSTPGAVLFSTSFESNQGFTTGSIQGQGAPPFAVSGSFSIASTAGNAHTGSQYTRITNTGMSTIGSWAFVDTTRTASQLATDGPIIRSTVWVNLSATGTIGTRTYSFGLEIYDEFAGHRMGRILMNHDGSITAMNGLSPGASFTTAPGVATRNAWHKLVHEADFSSHTLRFYFDGVAIATPAGFNVFDVNATGFGDADLFAIRGSSGTLTTADFRFDDLLIEQFRAPCPADLNADGVVDDADFVRFAEAYILLLCEDPEMPHDCPSDFNADMVVDDSDFQIFGQAYDALVCQ